ncbi:phosphotransferase family protein [Actinacidiphila acidipaludis]|uniref:Phosphotransferase n=1 Tax=Actinacidiphila acidipaludis TaxID=2873382 RepID=A0ABS7QCP6_9ACTN|nr:phosphotransferase [Streptomyces acidipaludis]MBY8880940.1 phosphotransferase [Streptomyces acidipaludis]
MLAGQFPWLKLREPRDGVFWYDMRWFPSEEYVLRLLRDGFGDTFRHVPRVCEQRVQDEASPVRRIGLIQFIEGVTLDKVRSRRPGRIADRYVRQIEELFGTLASVDAGSLVGHGSPAVEGCAGCDLASWPEQGGSTQFLGRLKHFTFNHAYEQRRRDMDDLLADLGVPSDKLAAFAERRPELTDRPRKLLHGDLHKKNFVVDRAGVLWTIDWELALVGDPLYDLATHLHLMGYPSDQEADVISRWERAVGAEAAAGAREDLPHYRAFKRVQSLCTDVLRTVARLSTAAREDGEGMAEGAPAGHRSGDRPAAPVARLRGAAAVVRRALEAAQPHLEVDKTQPPAAVEMALQAFLQRTEDV